MACVVCQHCQEMVFKEDVAMRDGYSYHKKCHKCYVCSETNLQNAEVFQGVIFCCSCSHRIFQGCSTARRSKNGRRRSKSRGKRRAQERKKESRARPIKGVLEMAHQGASDSSTSSYNHHSKLTVNALALSTELALQLGKEKESQENNCKELKKNSTEIGMTTEVTQELLRQMNCPVVSDRRRTTKIAGHTKNVPKEKGDTRFNRTVICSDLRIAELGASTEIAHMALRKQSEVPVIIQSRCGVKPSLSFTGLHQESEVSGDGNNEWLESTYSLKGKEDIRWLDRRMGSILKMPYKFFKKNVLNRSSLISVAEYNNYSSHYFLKKIKMLFHEEINEHQRRGMKRLYPTINRRKTPYKLGWLNLVAKVSAIMKPEISIKKQILEPVRCKHFKRSHSYRCMRAQVMKLAGPTKSELACLRNKIKNVFLPAYLRNLLGLSKRYPAIMQSQACGSDLDKTSLRNAKSS